MQSFSLFPRAVRKNTTKKTAYFGDIEYDPLGIPCNFFKDIGGLYMFMLHAVLLPRAMGAKEHEA